MAVLLQSTRSLILQPSICLKLRERLCQTLPAVQQSDQLAMVPNSLQLTSDDVEKAIEIFREDYAVASKKFTPWPERKPLIRDPNADSTDFELWLTRKRVYRISTLQREYELREKRKIIKSQLFQPRRHAALGPDLAISHFLVYRGGRVKFYGSDKWVHATADLPAKMDSAFKVEKIDASGCQLYYEGLDNLINLKFLEDLDVSNNPGLDDWACGRLACHFRNSKKLRYLNLSENPLITERGLESLVRIPTLQTLVITGTKAAKFKHLQLLELLFNDVNPHCRIEL